MQSTTSNLTAALANKRFGFLGSGKMAQAMAKGFLQSGKSIYSRFVLTFFCEISRVKYYVADNVERNGPYSVFEGL